MIHADGTPLSMGDHIWWNEGSCLGFIHEIVEDPSDQSTWGFEEPFHVKFETGGIPSGVWVFETFQQGTFRQFARVPSCRE